MEYERLVHTSLRRFCTTHEHRSCHTSHELLALVPTVPKTYAYVVDQVLPGMWLVSDFLVDRATAEYDKLLTLSESEIEDIKNKVSGP